MFYAGQFRLTSVREYVHGLTPEMGNHIDVVASTLSMFIDIGDHYEKRAFYLPLT